MTAVEKTLVPADFRLSNVPFLDRNDPKAFSTSFQEHFQAVSSKKAAPVDPLPPAQVDHKDVRHIKEYMTEGMVSYRRHPLPEITRTPSWSKLFTNFKMQTDPGEVDFHTTQSQSFLPHVFRTPTASVRPSTAFKMIQRVEKLPESIYKASFAPHQSSPLQKATVKHLAEGFPTIKGDGRHHHSFISHYNKTFQGAQSRPPQPVEKGVFVQHSSVALGDPGKIVERETTHAASFSRHPVCRPPVLKEHLKLNLGDYSEDPWSTTTRENFYCHKLENPAVLPRRNRNFSSIHKGDTNAGREKERMSVTTNKNSFSNPNTAFPEHVIGSDMMTKSNVQFSPPRLSGLYYTTTATDHYCRKDGKRARTATQPPSNILTGPENGMKLSTTMTDFLPKKNCKRTACQSQHRTNIRFPLAHQYFTTSHSEDFTVKPLTSQPPSCSQFTHHFVLQ